MDPATLSTVASLAPSATGIISEVGNALLTMRTNRQNREFAREQYEREKADNLAQWSRQNEYNSPSAQMERLQLAGLNPNLVYGKGADNLSQPIAPARGSVPNAVAPRVDLSRPFSEYQNFALRKAQTDNQTAQNTVLLQDALLKNATTASVIANTEKTKFNLGQTMRLADINANFLAESLRKMEYGNAFQVENLGQLVAKRESNIQKSAEEVLNLRAQRANTESERNRIFAQIEQIKSSTALQNLDIQLKKNGINPNDPIYMRVLGRIIGNDYSIGSVMKNIKKQFQK